MSETFIKKLPINEGSDYLIAHTIWTVDSVQIQIINFDTSGWSGRLLKVDLESSAEDLEIPFDAFYNECRRALTSNGGLEHFEYAIEDNKFILRKVRQFKEIFCQFPLVAETALPHKLLLVSTDISTDATNKFNLKVLDYQKLEMEFKMLTQSHKDVVAEKDKIERELLKRFCILLNAKKEKIAELQELLSEGRKLGDPEKSRTDSSNDTEQLTQMQPPHTTKKTLPKRKDFYVEKPAIEIPNAPEEVSTEPSSSSLNSQDIFDEM